MFKIIDQSQINSFDKIHRFATHRGLTKGPGNTFGSIYLTIHENIIEAVHYLINGQNESIELGEFLKEYLLGRSFDEISQLSNDELVARAQLAG